MARQAEVWLKVGVRLLVAGDPSVQHVTIEAARTGLDGLPFGMGDSRRLFSASFLSASPHISNSTKPSGR
jgi:hypothetical protein